ncbi:MAG: xylulokinase [Actinomycetota bacterium]|nr:xylulokinase [Actinomycetota bacterium]
MIRAVVGVDIGTSSSKGVLVTLDGRILATATRSHEPARPNPGWVEMDAALWWTEFVAIARELGQYDADIVAVGVSGMGPCLAVVDSDSVPLRPAILYGVDTRATSQIAQLTERFGAAAILHRTGSALSTQAVGPKLAWLADNEPDVFARSTRFFMPSSWLVYQLTDEYVLDHHSASQCTPMYDSIAHEWYLEWSNQIAPQIELPPLKWPGETAGHVSRAAALETGLPEGVPVIAGTIDAWSEALSVGGQNVGDLLLMYGTTMFLVNTIARRITVPSLWGTVGALPGTRNLAGGMATSGAITSWLRTIYGSPAYEELLAEAEASGPGARGLLMLPYFAGERTPVADPDARGVIAGLTIDHTRGDLYRAALEATAFGVRHNIEALRAAGGVIDRIVVAGGGTQGGVWTQIVSDVTGMEQDVPTVTIGASFGAAFLAANTIADVSIDDWNPIATRTYPRSESRDRYNELYQLYLDLYPATSRVAHALAQLNNGVN